jgi:SAM-dependent methyltransferase
VTPPTLPRPPAPRHPSAGNLSPRPTLVHSPSDTPGIPSVAFPVGSTPDTAAIRLGPDLVDGTHGRLVASVEGRRVLELGCGNGANAVALARAGAKVISVDPSAERVAAARRLAEEHDVRVEFHQSDLAELPFVRADQIDVALAVYSLAGVWDLQRVFRQVHRVLRPEATIVITLPHPLHLMTESDEDGRVRLARTAFDGSTVGWSVGDTVGDVQPHRASDVFLALQRTNFRVDTFLEPEPDRSPDSPYRSPLDAWVPATLVLRARKEGI